jgi:hypothetical protein
MIRGTEGKTDELTVEVTSEMEAAGLTEFYEVRLRDPAISWRSI